MKKGISLVVLLISLLIMLILATAIIMSGSYTLKGVEKANLAIEVAQIETLMKNYVTRKSGNISFETTKFSVANLRDEELPQFDDENIVNNEIELYVIDLEQIDAEETKYGNLIEGDNDRYLYSSVTGKVYYEKGIVSNNITYYYAVLDGE